MEIICELQYLVSSTERWGKKEKITKNLDIKMDDLDPVARKHATQVSLSLFTEQVGGLFSRLLWRKILPNYSLNYTVVTIRGVAEADVRETVREVIGLYGRPSLNPLDISRAKRLGKRIAQSVLQEMK